MHFNPSRSRNGLLIIVFAGMLAGTLTVPAELMLKRLSVPKNGLPQPTQVGNDYALRATVSPLEVLELDQLSPTSKYPLAREVTVREGKPFGAYYHGTDNDRDGLVDLYSFRIASGDAPVERAADLFSWAQIDENNDNIPDILVFRVRNPVSSSKYATYYDYNYDGIFDRISQKCSGGEPLDSIFLNSTYTRVQRIIDSKTVEIFGANGQSEIVSWQGTSWKAIETRE